MSVKLFDRWDTSAVQTHDVGLAPYITIKPMVVPRSSGRLGTSQIHKHQMHIVERLITKLMVPGHKGKKHKFTSGRCPASSQAITLELIRAFENIEKKTKQNPIQVLVNAIENAALLEEIASYRLGGIIARQAVVVSPYRRMDLALRSISQGVYHTNFGHKANLADGLTDELIAAANNDQKSFAIRERNRIEKEAEGAR